jgi:hypothetical protein
VIDACVAVGVENRPFSFPFRVRHQEYRAGGRPLPAGHCLAGTSGDRLAGFFVAGAALAVLSLLGSVFGLRREVAKLKRELKEKAGSLVTYQDRQV